VNSPLKRRDRRGAGLSADQGQYRTPQSNAALDDRARPFAVWIDAFGRRRMWSRYSNRSRGENEVAGLRRHGFDAVVEAAP
jgi:hypothetical protein